MLIQCFSDKLIKVLKCHTKKNYFGIKHLQSNLFKPTIWKRAHWKKNGKKKKTVFKWCDFMWFSSA